MLAMNYFSAEAARAIAKAPFVEFVLSNVASAARNGRCVVVLYWDGDWDSGTKEVLGNLGYRLTAEAPNDRMPFWKMTVAW